MKWWHWILWYLACVLGFTIAAEMIRPTQPKVEVDRTPIECVVSLNYPRETHKWKGYAEVKH